MLEEYKDARAPAPQKTDEERWLERRATIKARLARGEALSEIDLRWMEATRNSYWVRANEDFEAYASGCGG